MKISSNAKRDFDFLYHTKLDMIGKNSFNHPIDLINGVSALESWYVYESVGKVLATCEPEKLDKVLRSKASVNLQIRMWSEAMCDPLVLSVEELRTYCKEFPGWVFKATVNQARKLILKQIGFIPSFLHE